MKYFSHFMYHSPETPSKDGITDRLPSSDRMALRALNLPQEQLHARTIAIVELDEYINNPNKLFHGNAEAGFGSFIKDGLTRQSTIDEIIGHMKDVRALLLKSYNDNISAWNKLINTSLNEIEADGSANLEINATRMSQRKFLQRVIGESLSAKILLPIPKSTEANLTPAQLAEKHAEQRDLQLKGSRLAQFLTSLERYKQEGFFTNKGLDNGIFRTQQLIAQGKIQEAINLAKTFIDGEWKGVSVSGIIGDQHGLATALRAIGDTHNASTAYLSTMNEQVENKSDALKRLETQIEANSKNLDAYTADAERSYQQIIQSLPVSHPDRLYMETNKEASIQNLKETIMLSKTVRDFIIKNGDTGLSQALKEFNDMKGLYGFWNFTDENAKMTREIAIMIASIVVTMGASALVSTAASGARILSSARYASARQTFSGGKHVLGITQGVGAFGRGIVVEGARVATTIGNKAPAMRIFGNALVFTASDQTLRLIFPQHGDNEFSVGGFVEKLAHNTAMFAAFAGMEKFISGPLAQKFAHIKPNEAITLTQHGKQIATLTAGDIVAMHVLHAAESGRLEFGWESVFMALAFRIGFQSMQQQFPKQAEKIVNKSTDDVRQLISETAGKMPEVTPTQSQKLQNDINTARQAQHYNIPKNTAPTKDASHIRHSNKDNTIADTSITPTPKTGSSSTDTPSNSETSALRRIRVANGRADTLSNAQMLQNTEIRNKLLGTTGKTGDSITINGEVWIRTQNGKWRPENQPRGQSGGQPIAKTGQELWKALRLQQRTNTPIQKRTDTPMQNRINDLTGVNSKGTGMRSRNILTAEEAMQQTAINVRNKVKEMYHESTTIGSRAELQIRSQDGNIETIRVEKIADRQWKYEGRDEPFKMYYSKLSNAEGYFTSNTKTHEIINIKIEAPTPKSEMAKPETATPEPTAKSEPTKTDTTTPEPTKTNTVKSETATSETKTPNTQKAQIDAKEHLNTAIPGAGDALESALTSKDPGKIRAFLDEYWNTLRDPNMHALAGVTGLHLLRTALDAHKTNPYFTLPAELPDDKDRVEEICVKCMTNNLSTLDYTRHSTANNKIILNESRRMNISKRWQQKAEWKTAVTAWNELRKTYEENSHILEDSIIGTINAVITSPTPQNVQEFQRCIGMDADDNSTAQDGILGPNTTRKFMEFISEKMQLITPQESPQSDEKTPETGNETTKTEKNEKSTEEGSKSTESSAETPDDNVAEDKPIYD